MEQFQKLQ